MALPVVVVQESIADELVAAIVKKAKELKVGPAYDKSTGLGPVINARHRESVVKWIEKGIEEGAELVMDGKRRSGTWSAPCGVRNERRISCWECHRRYVRPA